MSLYNILCVEVVLSFQIDLEYSGQHCYYYVIIVYTIFEFYCFSKTYFSYKKLTVCCVKDCCNLHKLKSYKEISNIIVLCQK